MMIFMTGVNARIKRGIHSFFARKRLRLRLGYTLVEMLVVTLIFSIAAAILSEIFISFNQLHRRVADSAILGQDMRFAMELLVREARNDTIDYKAYGGTVNAVDSILKLKKRNGTQVWIAMGAPGALPGSPSCENTTIAHCLALSIDGGSTWSQITSNRVEVESFKVFVRPTVSPFVPVNGVYPNNIQPFVTVNLRLLYKAPDPKERVTLQAQTTVSSRVYKR